MQDSFTNFVDHFILLHTARFIDETLSADATSAFLAGSNAPASGRMCGTSEDELDEVWTLVATSVQDMLSKPRTPGERARLAHVEPSQYTSAVCRARARYVLWKLNNTRMYADASHAGSTDRENVPRKRGSITAITDHIDNNNGNDIYLTARRRDSTPVHESVPSSFDVTKDSLKRDVDAIYAAVRASLPSTLGLHTSDKSSEQSSDYAESDSGGCGLDSALHNSATSRQKMGYGSETDGANLAHIKAALDETRSGPSHDADDSWQTCSCNAVTQQQQYQQHSHTAHRDAASRDVPRYHRHGILDVNILSNVESARQCEIAAARNELLRKVHEWQADFYSRMHRWIDIPESVLQMPVCVMQRQSAEESSGAAMDTPLDIPLAGHAPVTSLPVALDTHPASAEKAKGSYVDEQREALLGALEEDLASALNASLSDVHTKNGCAERRQVKRDDLLCSKVDDAREGAPAVQQSLSVAACNLVGHCGEDADTKTESACGRHMSAVLSSVECSEQAAIEVATRGVGGRAADGAADQGAARAAAARFNRRRVIEYSDNGADEGG